MKRVTIFYKGKIWYETDEGIQYSMCPNGSYVRRVDKKTNTVYWDQIIEHEVETISLDRVPAWVRTWALIL